MAMHASMERASGAALRRTTTGEASFSITISSPREARASRPLMSRIASASEMRIVAISIMIRRFNRPATRFCATIWS